MTPEDCVSTYPYACKAADKILAAAAGTPWQRHAQSIALYLREGLPPGSAVTAILDGDLYGATRRADTTTSDNLAAIAKAVLWYAPSGVYGSREAVNAWLDWHADRKNAA